MARTICCTLGAGFILAGVAGFVEPDLLGMHLTPVHNVIHLVSGVLSLYFGFAGSTEAARVFSLVFGSVYAGLGILGFVAPSLVESLLHAESSAGTEDRLVADNIVHIIIGSLFLVGGLVRRAPAREAERSGSIRIGTGP
jgi:hypothetical protein